MFTIEDTALRWRDRRVTGSICLRSSSEGNLLDGTWEEFARKKDLFRASDRRLRHVAASLIPYLPQRSSRKVPVAKTARFVSQACLKWRL